MEPDANMTALAWQLYFERMSSRELRKYAQNLEGFDEHGIHKDDSRSGLIRALGNCMAKAPVGNRPGDKGEDDRLDIHSFLNPIATYKLQYRHFLEDWFGQDGFKEKLSSLIEQARQSIAYIASHDTVQDWQFGKDMNLKTFLEKKTTFKYQGKFRRQTSLEYGGTAVLIAQDVLLTAKHNLVDEAGRWLDTSELRFVFGFEKEDAIWGTNFHEERIFEGKLLKYGEGRRDDWALIRLEPNSITGRFPEGVPFKLNSSSSHPNAQDPLVLAGHPLGLPLKLVLMGRYIDRLTRSSFWTSFDAFKGNSGSPILNINTGLIEGIVTGGEIDFAQENGTIVHRRYSYEMVAKGLAGARAQTAGSMYHAVKGAIEAFPIMAKLAATVPQKEFRPCCLVYKDNGMPHLRGWVPLPADRELDISQDKYETGDTEWFLNLDDVTCTTGTCPQLVQFDEIPLPRTPDEQFDVETLSAVTSPSGGVSYRSSHSIGDGLNTKPNNFRYHPYLYLTNPRLVSDFFLFMVVEVLTTETIVFTGSAANQQDSDGNFFREMKFKIQSGASTGQVQLSQKYEPSPVESYVMVKIFDANGTTLRTTGKVRHSNADDKPFRF